MESGALTETDPAVIAAAQSAHGNGHGAHEEFLMHQYEDRAQQEREVNYLIAPRYIGERLGSERWQVIKGSDRIGIHMYVDRVHARGV